MSGLNYKRVRTADIYIGDNPWNPANFIVNSNFVTSVSVGSGSSVSWLSITHSDPGYSYQVYAQSYANRSNTSDNDAGM